MESRLTRVENYLQLGLPAAGGPTPEVVPSRAEAFEFAIGQKVFATVGIVVLVLGAVFTLSRPCAGLPAAAPALIGYGLAAALFLLARAGRRGFALISGNLRGAAMAMLYFATLRLCFFGGPLSAAAPPGMALLVAVVAANLALARRWRSPWLAALALATGSATALAVGSAWFVLASVIALSALAVMFVRKCAWPGFALLGIALTYGTYLLWAVGDPLLGRPVALAAAPPASLAVLLACAAILAAGCRAAPAGEPDNPVSNLGALFNGGAAFGLFVLQSAASFDPVFARASAAAAVVFLALAVAFWTFDRSRVATFIYAMTGYLALSLAIIRAAEIPQVFIWLSLQSVVVVATAIWFQSRLIVVANFIIFVAIVAAYMALARVETGISLAFGVVALGTARLLNWQGARLELKTDLMRNAYLVSALVVFPYALYHLVPAAWVGLAWVGAALFYYGMNLIVRNRKYRWMGHATLLFTALYLLVAGISRLEPLPRNLSFLVLGAVLLGVSIVFTRLRARIK